MKNLAIITTVLCLMFGVASCGGNKKNENKEDSCCSKKEKKECCEKGKKDDSAFHLTEEVKKEYEALAEKWKNFETLAENEQKELIAQRKAFIDKQKAAFEEKKSEIDALKDAEKEKAAELKDDFIAEWEKFETLTVAEQKALIDKVDTLFSKKGSCDKKSDKDKKGCCDKKAEKEKK